jgi:hypothetical protein
MSNMISTTIPPRKKNKASERWCGAEEDEDEGGVSVTSQDFIHHKNKKKLT